MAETQPEFYDTSEILLFHFDCKAKPGLIFINNYDVSVVWSVHMVFNECLLQFKQNSDEYALLIGGSESLTVSEIV